MITKLRLWNATLALICCQGWCGPLMWAQSIYQPAAWQQSLGNKQADPLPASSSRRTESQSDPLPEKKPAPVAEELPSSAARPALTVESNPSMVIAPPAEQTWDLPVPCNHCNFSACNLPPQPEAPVGRCQPCIRAVDCANSRYPQSWSHALPYNFGPLGHGEHIGPVRLPSVNDVRLRIGDRLRFMYIETRGMDANQYRLMVGDELLIESLTDVSIRQGDLASRGLQIQNDGFLYPKLIGAIRAEGLTIPQLRRNLEVAYKDKIKNPAIDVIPVRTNVRLASLLASVDTRGYMGGGQSFQDAVHQDGTIRLPGIGAVCVLGMTLDELKREINLRYAQEVFGLEVEPVIEQEAAHYVYVVGEVNKPDRYQLVGPTSVSQALAMAGSIKVGGNMRSIVIFRRMEDWRVVATKIDIRGEQLGRVLTPMDDIYLRDNDLIIVPPMPIKVFDNFVKLVFTDGIYGIIPFQGFSITKFQQAGIN